MATLLAYLLGTFIDIFSSLIKKFLTAHYIYADWSFFRFLGIILHNK